MTVDVSTSRPYVPAAMRLLLLLSVLLSALTGVGTSARAPDIVQAVAGRSLPALASARAERAAQVRPPSVLPTLPALAATAAMPLPVHAGEPLWANRRRE